MRSWGLRVAMAALLALAAGVMTGAAAQAAPAPPGSCWFENLAAGGFPAAPAVGAHQQVWNFSAGTSDFSSQCAFTLTGTFTVRSSLGISDGTLTPCEPESVAVVPFVLSGAGCASYGSLDPQPRGGLGFFHFIGTITAVNDGASQDVSCDNALSADTGGACWLTYPGQVQTL